MSDKKEIRERINKLETQRESLEQSLVRAYERTDSIKKKIRALDEKLTVANKEYKTCLKS